MTENLGTVMQRSIKGEYDGEKKASTPQEKELCQRWQNSFSSQAKLWGEGRPTGIGCMISTDSLEACIIVEELSDHLALSCPQSSLSRPPQSQHHQILPKIWHMVLQPSVIWVPSSWFIFGCIHTYWNLVYFTWYWSPFITFELTYLLKHEFSIIILKENHHLLEIKSSHEDQTVQLNFSLILLPIPCSASFFC